jgi:hypothetical protein
MRKIFLILTLFILVSKVDAQMPPYSVTRMAVDEEKNFILYSSFQDAIQFSDTTLRTDYWYDLRHFIAKCDSDMNLLWYSYFGDWDMYAPLFAELVADGDGNTYMACLLNRSLPLNDSVTVYTEVWPDSARLLLIKYDPYGRFIWYRKSSLLALSKSKIALGVDSSYNVYMSYNFYPYVTFGADTLRETLTDTGTFVVKFDSAGNEQWLIGLSGSKQNNDFCVSQIGTTFIAGTASSLQGFGPITFTIPDGPAPSLSVCNSGGSPYWQANFTGRRNEHKAVGVGPNERPVVAGKFYDTLGFASLPPFSLGDSAFFVASYNSDGTERWAKKVDGFDPTDVGVTSGNDIFLLGEKTKSTVVIDTTTLSMADADGTVMRLDSNGNYLCNFKFSNFFVESSSVGPSDEFHICGRADFRYSYYSGFWRPVFAGDSMHGASDACIYIVTIGSNCELRSIDSLSNWYRYGKVPELSRQSKLLLYPNPVDNNLCVRIEGVSISSATLNIRDARGKVVRTMETKSKDVDEDVSMLPPGIYVLEWISGTERVVEKFIKR